MASEYLPSRYRATPSVFQYEAGFSVDLNRTTGERHCRRRVAQRIRSGDQQPGQVIVARAFSGSS